MPDARLARTRETLPSGYQFGDGQCVHDYRARGWVVPDLDAGFYTAVCVRCGHDAGPVNMAGFQTLLHGEGRWRPPQENAADRLARYEREYIDPAFEAGPI